MPAQTDNTDILSALNQAIAALNNIEAKLDPDRIAPQGDSIHAILNSAFIGANGPYLAELADIEAAIDNFTDQFIKCCNKIKQFPDPKEFEGTLDYGPPDSLKCEMAADFVGSMYQFLLEVEKYGPTLVTLYAIVLAAVGSVALSIGAITSSLVVGIAKEIVGMSFSDYEDLVDKFGAELSNYHQIIYEASTPQEAIDNLKAHNANIQWLGGTNAENVANYLIASETALQAIWEKDTTTLSLNYGNWYTGDCSEYQNPGGQGIGPAIPCNPPLTAFQGAGTPNIFLPDGTVSGSPVTITSTFDGVQYNVTLRFTGVYYVKVTGLTRAGVNYNLYPECDSTAPPCQQGNLLASSLPVTFRTSRINFNTNDGSFDITMEFNTTTQADIQC